jgi:NADPH2:quinone reductase
MKAAYIDQPGPAQTIHYGDLPLPAVGQRDVLVQVLAVTVNAVDTYIVSGQFQTPLPCPFIIGRDVAGIVAAVGEAVRRFRPGERVWANNQGYGGRQGTFAEYCSIDEDLLYHLPDQADLYETITVFHSGLTAAVGLAKVQLQFGETVFINGGDGNVGTAILQIARAMGARVIVTSADERKAAWCRQLGADRIINYKTQDVHKVLQEAVPQGVNVYWDTTAHFDAARALAVSARRGRLVVMAGLTQQTTLPVGPFYTRNCTLYGFTVTDATREELGHYAEQINQWVRQGVLKGRIARKLPLSQAAQAYEIYRTEDLVGKLVLAPE